VGGERPDNLASAGSGFLRVHSKCLGQAQLLHFGGVHGGLEVDDNVGVRGAIASGSAICCILA